MSWPNPGEGVLRAVLEWTAQRERPVLWVGEMPRPDLGGFMGMSGCASDRFFEAVQAVRDLDGHSPRDMFDRAVVPRVRSEWVERWRAVRGRS